MPITGYATHSPRSAPPATSSGRVSAFHLEDQTFPKKCGHYDDKGLVLPGRWAEAARRKRALTDHDFIVTLAPMAIASNAPSRARRAPWPI